MSEDTLWRAIAIFSVILIGIVGAFVKHIIDDARTRERVATLEADSKTVKDEVKGLREDRHDFKDELKRGTWELVQARYERFTDALEAFKAEILRLIGK